MPPLVHRGARGWLRFPTFQLLCCLRCTTRSSTPLFIDSPINTCRRCMTVLDLRSRSVTACRFVRWPGMGAGHAMSDMLHDRRLRRGHLSPTTCLGSISRGGTLQPPCLYPTRHAMRPTPLLRQGGILFPECRPQADMPIGNRTAPGFKSPLTEVAQDYPPRFFRLSLATLHG